MCARERCVRVLAICALSIAIHGCGKPEVGLGCDRNDRRFDVATAAHRFRNAPQHPDPDRRKVGQVPDVHHRPFSTAPKGATCPKSRADKVSSMWRSQLGQDAWVAAATGYKRSGFFVELGAGDGLYLSNTAALEEHLGWTGICIEPVPRQYGELIRNRRCACDNSCVGMRDGDQVSFVVDQKYDEHHHFSGIVNTLNGFTPQGTCCTMPRGGGPHPISLSLSLSRGLLASDVSPISHGTT